jgi:hypothetical protein
MQPISPAQQVRSCGSDILCCEAAYSAQSKVPHKLISLATYCPPGRCLLLSFLPLPFSPALPSQPALHSFLPYLLPPPSTILYLRLNRRRTVSPQLAKFLHLLLRSRLGPSPLVHNTQPRLVIRNYTPSAALFGPLLRPSLPPRFGSISISRPQRHIVFVHLSPFAPSRLALPTSPTQTPDHQDNPGWPWMERACDFSSKGGGH